MTHVRIAAIPLQSIPDPARGGLGVAEVGKHVPFAIQRLFYMYDMREGIVRGEHAHRAQEQFLIAIAGSVIVRAEDAAGATTFRLDSPCLGLFVPAMTWLTVEAGSASTICVVLASGLYDEADYIRDRGAFLALITHNRRKP